MSHGEHRRFYKYKESKYPSFIHYVNITRILAVSSQYIYIYIYIYIERER